MKIRWLQQLPTPCPALPLSRKPLPLTRNLWAKSNVAAGTASVCSPKQGRKPVPNVNCSNTVGQAMAVLEWLVLSTDVLAPDAEVPGVGQGDWLATVITSAAPLSTGCFMSQHSSLPQWKFAQIRPCWAENVYSVMSRIVPRITLHFDNAMIITPPHFRVTASLTRSLWHDAVFI